jgi:ABC-type transport system involved in multi-copper enzyme maturation permease subunit
LDAREDRTPNRSEPIDDERKLVVSVGFSMTVLPIAERELRVAARSPRTYWSRAAAAFGVIVMAVVIFQSYGRFASAKVGGQQIFSALAYLALAYSVFAGAALTADCLSSEKREETLGFLFLTDLKGYDVVFGKLFATSLRSIYGLLATFPVISLPLLLGGVRAAEFWRVVLVLLATLLLSLSIGLLVSTLYRRQRVTTHLASLTMLLLAVVPAGVSFVAKSIGGVPAMWLDPAVISPIYSLQASFESGYQMARVTGPSFWTALSVQLGFSLLLLCRASWLLPNSWQQGALKIHVPCAAAAAPTRPEPNLAFANAHRHRVLDENPFYWLANRGWGMTAGMSVLVGLVWLWGLFAYNDKESFAAVQGVGILLVGLTTRLLIAVCAAQRFAEDKQTGALDLILTTPIRVRELIAGQWRATIQKLRWPVLCSLALYFFLIFGSPDRGSGNEQEATVVWFTTASLFIITLADSLTLGWLGMWAGLTVRQVPHGAAVSLCKVVILPAIVPAAFIWNHGFSSADEYLKTNPYWIPALWLTLALITDLGWTLWARQKLFRNFRLAATERILDRGATLQPAWLARLFKP